MKKKKVKDNDDVAKIYRKATQKDIDIWSAARDREEPMKVVARELAIRLDLEMKIRTRTFFSAHTYANVRLQFWKTKFQFW